MKKMIFLFFALYPVFSNAQTYNSQAAVEYALYWWDGRNTNNWIKDPSNFDTIHEWGYPYHNYNRYGGDCANFVSQCLIAGGRDLSAGTDGKGNGVDRRLCIPGVFNLQDHLLYKKVPRVGSLYPTDTLYIYHTLGDVLIMRNENSSVRHAVICSYIDGKTPRYAAHSKDVPYSRRRSYGSQMVYSSYFNLTYPAHCFNCKKDEDEDEIDCGGASCPSCDHSPEERSYVTPNSNLPPVVRATKKITAGNAEVRVLPGQNVSFITAGDGSINLLPGFEAQVGANFDTQIKSSSTEITAICKEYCSTVFFPNALVLMQDKLIARKLVNAVKIEYQIYDIIGHLVTSGIIHISREGDVVIWDLVTDMSSFPSVAWYIAEIRIHYCHFTVRNYSVKFVVNAFKSFIETLEETEEYEPPITYHTPNYNETISPEAPETHTFSIIPNPNTGAFQLKTNFPLADIVHLKIVNLLGITVYETQALSSNAIHLPATASGHHSVVVTLKDGTVLTQKMVIQR